MPRSSHRFQAPKGTRDFYPQDLAVRRYIESVWRQTAISHGFDEIEGPTFEHLDLYTVKSGPEIVSELFTFRRQGGDVDYALRPEFTPTLARMYAAQARSLPKPTRWFSIGPFFRAERPQRGRLREHIQWNVDIIGTPADGVWKAHQEVEILSLLVDVLSRFGLTPGDVRVKFGQRRAVIKRLEQFSRTDAQRDEDLALLDARLKIGVEEYRRQAGARGWPEDLIQRYDPLNREIVRMDADPDSLPISADERGQLKRKLDDPTDLFGALRRTELAEWCEFDSMIIRGLAYYTDLVFEVHEVRGKERAVAGGGRYDNLIELFGGPPTPAVGIAMGDVVLRLILEERRLLKDVDEHAPRPDAFLIAAKEAADPRFAALLASLRRAGLHVRHSDRSTRNVGKLLGEAAKARARYAVILGDELQEGCVAVKDLASGEQRNVPLERLEEELRRGS